MGPGLLIGDRYRCHTALRVASSGDIDWVVERCSCPARSEAAHPSMDGGLQVEADQRPSTTMVEVMRVEMPDH
jgi:hypothetical protein